MRGMSASKMQLGLIVSYVFAAFPYLLYDSPFWVKVFLAGMLAPIVLYTILASICTGIYKIERYVLSGKAVPDGVVDAETYINIVALANLIWLFVLVAVTGGLSSSSFIPLLFMIPSFTMIYRATKTGAALWIGTVCFGVLVVLKIPVLLTFILSWLARFAWILSFYAANATPEAYAWSIVATTAASVWALHFQWSISPRAVPGADARP